MDINTVALTGRLGSDLELRTTKNGTSVANANLAVECGFGEKKRTSWIGLDFWGKSADSASRLVGKGSKIAVCGRLEQTEYEKDGQKVSKTRVVVENWTFADSKGGGVGGSQTQAPARRESAHVARASSDDGDDIPF